jgi:hypothetical protein
LVQAIQDEIEAWSREDPASRLLAATVFVFGLFIVSSVAIIQRRSYSALPWNNMWDFWIWYLKPQPILLVTLVRERSKLRGEGEGKVPSARACCYP